VRALYKAWVGVWISMCASCADPAAQALQPSAGTSAQPAMDADSCSSPLLTAVPNTVTELVDHLNKLPKPTTLPCLLASLPGPLPLHATRSILSAQPAVGQRSPRVFVLYEQLIMSVALDGMGKHLLEFGELRPDAHTLKAEIEFPVAAEVTHAAPFERVLFKEGQTSCAFCHAAESRDESVGFTEAYTSVAYRPTDRQAQVTVPELAGLLAQCDHAQEPERCAMLTSLFARGMPVEQAFPADFRVFQ
jgi:hypothetical protein